MTTRAQLKRPPSGTTPCIERAFPSGFDRPHARASGEETPPTLTREEQIEIHRRLYAAFTTTPDSANILQGVRPFRKGKPHVRVVLYPSPKNGQAFIPCEGRLEAQMAESLEIDPDIKRYRAQPLAIPGARGRPLFPDFAAEHHDGTFTIIDVKPSGRLLDPKVTARMKVVRHVLQQTRLRHRLVTEVELEAQPARQIRESLRRGAAAELTSYNRHRVLAHLNERPMTVGDLRRHLMTLGLDVHLVEKLAVLGHIRFPTHMQWSEHAPLEVIHGTDQEPATGRGTVHAARIAL